METEIFQTRTTEKTIVPWISWGAIFGGLASGLAAYLLLTLLGGSGTFRGQSPIGGTGWQSTHDGRHLDRDQPDPLGLYRRLCGGQDVGALPAWRMACCTAWWPGASVPSSLPMS